MKGFTLLELIISVLVITALATLTFSSVSDQINARRYEETRAKMEAIRIAILGDPTTDEQSQRTRFGYIGDMGILPVTLDSLVTRGTQPVYSYDGVRGFGSGWRGPYLSEQLTTASSITKDAWGNSFVYTTSGSLTITSLGADKAAGGTLYNRDITLTIPQNQYLSTVQGFVHDNALRLGTVNVELRYPISGNQTWAISTSNSQGAFNFTNVPIGVRSMIVGTMMTHRRFVVDKSTTIVPFDALNLIGVPSLTGTTIATSGINFSGTITSTYSIPLEIDYLMVNFERNGGAICNFMGELLPSITSGIKYKVKNTLTINPGGQALNIQFCGTIAGCINANHPDVYFTIFWKSNSLNAQKDSICYNFCTTNTQYCP